MAVKVFELTGDINLVPIKSDAQVKEIIGRKEPLRKAAIWQRVSLMPLRGLAKKGTPLGDCPYYGAGRGTLLVSDRLRQLIEAFTHDEIEFLPVEIDGETGYWYMNVLCVLDALDEEKSELKRFSDGGIMYVIQAAYCDDVINGHPIFRLTNYSGVFVTEEMKNYLQANRLIGLTFRDTMKHVENPFQEVFDQHEAKMRAKKKPKRGPLH